MRLRGSDGQTLWLGYGMNVHPGGEAATTLEAIRTTVAPLKQRLGVEGPFGLAVRWSAAGCRELLDDHGVFEALVDALRAHELRIFTGNAFVHGAFHGTRIKDAVYRPDWSEPERADYTVSFAEVLGRLAQAGVCAEGPLSLSTAPISFKAWPDASGRADAGLAALGTVLARLAEMAERSGTHVQLCLEPEPGCTLETTPELLAAVASLRARTDVVSEGDLAGLAACYDVCHQAVEWEDAVANLTALAAADVPLGKLQASCALELPDPTDADGRAALARFDEPVYLHQVGARDADGTLHVARDLSEVLDDPAWRDRGPWRSHFHVPVFRRALVGGLRTTQPELERALRHVAREGSTNHIEIETYTWDVIPEAEKAAGSGFDLVEALEREMRWTLDVLAREGVHPLDVTATEGA